MLRRPLRGRRRSSARPAPTTGGSPIDPVLDAYDRARSTPHRSSACNAPSTNLYFQANGRVAPCWRHFTMLSPVWSPELSIADIWNGPEFTTARQALAAGRFEGRCGECERDIRAGNQPLAAAYDNDRPIGDWPTMVEIELSNLCNLECVMCTGELSSRIRKNREGLPPLDIPYDDSFVDQLADLLPHLHELRVNGGEPLLQPMVHALGARVAELRPDLRVTIATNGTVLNRKVKHLLETCNIHLNISIDSLVPERYEAIRVHADFASLMENVEYFHRYCVERDRNLCIMVNPMRDNWREMPDFVHWCTERDLPLWFNTIVEPANLALHSLDAEELDVVVTTLRSAALPTSSSTLAHRNRTIFERLVHQVESWRDAATPTPTPVELSPRR